MRFYIQPHQFFCGIDLHAHCMYLYIFDIEGKIVLHRNMKAYPDTFLKAIAPYREGMLPQAYVYPPAMRATRDWLRRRIHLMRKRAERLAHIQNTNSQYNLAPL